MFSRDTRIEVVDQYGHTIAEGTVRREPTAAETTVGGVIVAAAGVGLFVGVVYLVCRLVGWLWRHPLVGVPVTLVLLSPAIFTAAFYIVNPQPPLVGDSWEADVHRGIRDYPTNPVAWMRSGVFNEHHGRLDQALRDYETGLKYSNVFMDSMLRRGRGSVLARLGREGEARTAFSQAGLNSAEIDKELDSLRRQRQP